MLHIADPTNRNQVKGKDAVNFFKRSGVPVSTLKEIWVIASTNGEYLDKEEFYVALRLIAYAQNNIPVTADSILQKKTSPLPKFEDNNKGNKSPIS